MSRFLSLLGVTLALLLPVPAIGHANEESGLRPSPTSTIEEDYHLGTGDKVRVIVFGEEDLSGEFQIDGSGRISLPLVGQIGATGQTAPGLEDEIAGKLSKGYLKNPRVSVEISAYRPFYVIGEVNKPGEYPYVNDMSALNAVALAGGYSQRANEGVVYIRRNGSAREEKVAADQMTRIWPGDVVRVPVSLFWSVMSVASPVVNTGAWAYSVAP